jgi:hypothetical protein
MKKDFIITIKKYLAGIDWNLLIFLVLFVNVKLWVKLIGLCFIYMRKFDFSFGFSFKKSRLPLFYPAMIGIAILNCLLYGLFKNTHYLVMLLGGISTWIFCILAIHQVKWVIEETGSEKIHKTLELFFYINSAVSLCNLAAIMLDAGVLNPYTYQGNYQKYFIGTGDFIRGISFDTSTTNAILNAFGIMFFLARKRFGASLLCLAVLLLTCSNLTNVLVVAALLVMFIFKTGRNQKSVIIIMLATVVLFMTKISPQNNKYAIMIAENFFGRHSKIGGAAPVAAPITERPDSTLTAGEKKYKLARLYLDSISRLQTTQVKVDSLKKPKSDVIVKTEMPRVNIHAPEYQHKQDSSATRLQALVILKNEQRKDQADTISKHLPGKVVAFVQLFQFFQQHPAKVVTGTGLGNFSSKMAFRASGLKIAGGYPPRFTYLADDFRKNHFLVYLAYFSTDSVYHSIANAPNSVYAQLLGEYGLLGICFFLFCYVNWFTGSFRKLTYGLPVLLITLGTFVSEYWFEQLSIVVVFELLMLLDIKTSQEEADHV